MLTTSFTVPAFLLMMPAGVLADRRDRRKILLVAQSIQTAPRSCSRSPRGSGGRRRRCCSCRARGSGIGSALSSPSWNSIVPELVPRALTAEAVTLNSVAFNIARAVGPALGGLVLAARGPGMAFFLNALSFLAVIEVLRRYDGVQGRVGPRGSPSRRSGARRRSVARCSPPSAPCEKTESLRAPHIAVAAFGLAAASVPALLSLFREERARRERARVRDDARRDRGRRGRRARCSSSGGGRDAPRARRRRRRDGDVRPLGARHEPDALAPRSRCSCSCPRASGGSRRCRPSTRSCSSSAPAHVKSRDARALPGRVPRVVVGRLDDRRGRWRTTWASARRWRSPGSACSCAAALELAPARSRRGTRSRWRASRS